MNSAPLSLSEIDLVAIGCSAGGLDVLSRILPQVGSRFPAIVVGIHLSPDSRSLIAEVLQPKCRVPVQEALDKEKIERGTIYFTSPGYHLLVEPDWSFSFSVEDPVNFSRPSIDVLFESAAVAYRERLLGILLTGANHDGAAGLETISRLGGRTIVQDPFTAEHSAMPQSALNRFKPDRVSTLGEIVDFFKEGVLHG